MPRPTLSEPDEGPRAGLDRLDHQQWERSLSLTKRGWRTWQDDRAGSQQNRRPRLPGTGGRRWWRPADPQQLLEAHRFDVARDHDLLTLAEGLDLPLEGNEGSLRGGRVLIATRR